MLHILGADIGGTNCRIALFTYNDNKIIINKSCILPTATVNNSKDLAKSYVDFILNDYNLDRKIPIILSIAFAGNVGGKTRVKLTNSKLDIDMDELKNMLNVNCTHLVNDFVAQACAFCVQDIYNNVSVILQSDVLKEEGTVFLENSSHAKNMGHKLMAILGAGTGLGIASLISFDADNYLAMPSERGHSAFPFVGEFEYELSEFIKEKLDVPYASCEHILSGNGISLLHEFLTKQELSAHEICTNYLKGDLLHYFSMFLGRACRDLALSTLSEGGIYLTGGVVAKNPIIAQHDSFRKEFYLSPKYSEWLKGVPVYLNTNESSGLWGAAYSGIMYYRKNFKVDI